MKSKINILVDKCGKHATYFGKSLRFYRYPHMLVFDIKINNHTSEKYYFKNSTDIAYMNDITINDSLIDGILSLKNVACDGEFAEVFVDTYSGSEGGYAINVPAKTQFYEQLMEIDAKFDELVKK